MVPRTVEAIVEITAIASVFPSSRCIVAFSASLRYQSRVKPVQRTPYADLLKEKRIITAMGA